MRVKYAVAMIIALSFSIVFQTAYAAPKKNRSKSKKGEEQAQQVQEQTQATEKAAETDKAELTTAENSATTNSTVLKPLYKEPGNMAIGLSLGVLASPVNFKYFLSESASIEIQGPLLTSLWLGIGMSLNVDYLYEGKVLANIPHTMQISWQAGGGLHGYFYNSSYYYSQQPARFVTAIGIHGNVGPQFLFYGIPFSIQVEYRPGLEIISIPFPTGRHDNAGNVIYENAWTFSGSFINVGLNFNYHF